MLGLDYATLISFSDNHSDLDLIVYSCAVILPIHTTIILAQAHLGTNRDNRSLIMQ